MTESEIDLRVTKAGVITAINVAPGVVTIDAAKLNISGIVTAGGLALEGDLSATNALISNLRAGNSGFTSVSTNDIQTIGATITGSMSVAGNISGAINISGIFGKFSSVYEAGEVLSDRYLGKTAKAADSNKLNGAAASSYALWTDIDTMMANWAVITDASYLGKTAKAADSDKLDGYHYDAFSFAGHTHNYAAASHGHAKADISDFPTRTSASFVTQVLLATTSDVFMKTLSTTAYAVTKATLDVTKNTYYFYT